MALKEAILLLTKFKTPADGDNLGGNDSLLNNETNVSLAPDYETNVSLVYIEQLSVESERVM